MIHDRVLPLSVSPHFTLSSEIHLSQRLSEGEVEQSYPEKSISPLAFIDHHHDHPGTPSLYEVVVGSSRHFLPSVVLYLRQ